MENSWPGEVEQLLEKIRINSVVLSERHRSNFYEYKSLSKWFDLPIIVISVRSSSFSVGSQSYIEQDIISTITCSISMIVTILSSIKLYLNLEDSLRNENDISKQFNLLSLDIYKVLHLNKSDRSINGLEYLNKKFNHYTHLIDQSQLLRRKLKRDELEEIDRSSYFSDTDSSNSTNV